MACPTSGVLNTLNELAKLNSRRKTIAVMSLVNYHQPQTPQEIQQLIEHHCYYNCPCGNQSSGTITKFASRLYYAQYRQEYQWLMKSNYKRYQECYDFMYYLFCVSPLIGIQQEKSSKQLFVQLFKKHHIPCYLKNANQQQDMDYAIDYFLLNPFTNKTVGIQVKSTAFLGKKKQIEINNDKNAKSSYEVFYHYYNPQNYEFDLTATTELFTKILQKLK